MSGAVGLTIHVFHQISQKHVLHTIMGFSGSDSNQILISTTVPVELSLARHAAKRMKVREQQLLFYSTHSITRARCWDLTTDNK